MKRVTMTTLSIAMAILPGLAQAQNTSDNRIEMSCYRGPFKEVIWDKANPQFVDSLENYGYPRYQAQLMADSICTDPALIDDVELMKTSMVAMIQQTPPSRFQ